MGGSDSPQITAEVDKGSNPDELAGVFVVNHFRNLDPNERNKPLTDHAVRYLKLYRFSFFTTYFLFDIVKRIHKGDLTKQEARRLVIEGQAVDEESKG